MRVILKKITIFSQHVPYLLKTDNDLTLKTEAVLIWRVAPTLLVKYQPDGIRFLINDYDGYLRTNEFMGYQASAAYF